MEGEKKIEISLPILIISIIVAVLIGAFIYNNYGTKPALEQEPQLPVEVQSPIGGGVPTPEEVPADNIPPIEKVLPVETPSPEVQSTTETPATETMTEEISKDDIPLIEKPEQQTNCVENNISPIEAPLKYE